MCFNQKISGSLALFGVVLLVLNHKYPSKDNNYLKIIIIFYTLMETLQTIQYSLVNNCDSVNRFFTEISYIFVIVQPLMWNWIFLHKKRTNKLKNVHKGILQLAIVLCAIWIFANILRRFKFYSNYNPSKNNDNLQNETLTGSTTCTYQKNDEHLYWNYEMFSIPGADANWFMYLVLWCIPGLLINEFISIFGIFIGLFISYIYIKVKKQSHHIMPSLWCLISIPTLLINTFAYYKF
jgi:hypothetical protein